MIVGIGLDIVSAARIARMLAEHGSRFEERLFTAAERDECAGRADRADALAARFAAKEACFKALGTGWSDGVSFLQIEVIRRGGRSPELRLSGRAAAAAGAKSVRHIHVSLTHHAGLAAAAVVLES